MSSTLLQDVSPAPPLMISPLEIPLPEPVDFSKQAVEVPGTRRPGQTGHYQNAVWGFKAFPEEGPVYSLPDVFELGYSLEKNGQTKNKPFLGHRPYLSTEPLKFASDYVWSTYAEADERRQNVGSALEKYFRDGTLGGGEYETVGIWSQNRPEWQIIELACHAYSKVSVSLYDTLGKDSVEYIIQHAHLTVIFVTSQHVPLLLAMASKVPMLKLIVSVDELTSEAKRIMSIWSRVANVRVMELSELEQFGKANRLTMSRPVGKQLATICYTSGTTSGPKGVLLTHSNLVSSVKSNLRASHFGEKGGIMMSYLPLAHIYERITELCTMALGGQIGFFTGDPLRLLEDASILKPNFFPSVPRVLNRVYQSAMLAGQTPGLKGYLFRTAMDAKLKKFHETGDNTHMLWDRLVFRKIQALLGGNVELVSCGSAPISVDVMDFLKIAFSCDVIEGYGMTENCGTCTRCWPNDPSSSGTVGAPQPCNEIKLVDVPSMNYTSNDKPNPRGEVCLRGNNCFSTYYKDEKNTRETVDDEGWLHTGDVGEIDSAGRLKIIDRIKNIMKLAQGEYVALEKIENVYGLHPLVAQLYVHGESLQDHLVGVIVPDPTQFALLCNSIRGTKIGPTDSAELATAARDPAVAQAVLKEITQEAKKAALKGFEMMKKIHLTTVPFSTENGLLTPTFKVRRKDCSIYFKEELAALYAQPMPALK